MSVCFNREQSNTWNPYNIRGIITGPARSHPAPPPSAINTIKEGGFRHRYHTHTHIHASSKPTLVLWLLLKALLLASAR